MNFDRVFDIAGAIVTVALVTVLVTNKGTGEVIRATGSAFAGSLKAAQGR